MLLPPPFFSPTFSITLVSIVAVVTGWYLVVSSQYPEIPAALQFIVPALVCAATLVLRKLTRPQAVPPVSFFDDHILAPRHAETLKLTRLGYDDIISVGVVAVTIYTLIGTILGSFSGYYGGKVDAVIMRLADIVLSFPSLILIITVVSVLGPSIYNIMLVIGLLGWPPIARGF